MLYPYRTWGRAALLFALFVCLALLPILTVQSQTAPEPVGLRPDAPPYALHGPYWVGTRQQTIEDGSDRALTIRLWYPALNAGGQAESISYTIDHGPNFPPATIAGRALADAEPNIAQGPYPLIVYSPGSGAMPEHHAYMLEHLASYGFVVIAAGHPGTTTVDFMQSFVGEEEAAIYFRNDALAYIYRPLDVGREITIAERLTTEQGALTGLIDVSHVVVMGPSFGGYTALAAAGVPINYAVFKTWCAANPSACELEGMNWVSQYEADVAAVLGVDPAQMDRWPSLGDPRIDAVVAIVPGSMTMFDDEGFAALTLPTLLIAGGADESVPRDRVDHVYAAISSPIKGEIVLENFGHMIANFTCDASPDYVAMGFSAFCMDSVWDTYRAHDLANHFTTAFLLDVLKGDEAAHAALAPDSVSFPSITYEAEGF